MAAKEIYLDKSGFTMIELLVSVAIIGLLASMATASFQDYRARAYDAQAIGFQRNALFALEALSSDADETELVNTNQNYQFRTQTDLSTPIGDDILRKLLQDSVFPDLFFFVSLNITCQYQTCPGGSSYIYSYVNAGHCKSTSSSDPNAKYNYHTQSHDRTTNGSYLVTKESRGCV